MVIEISSKFYQSSTFTIASISKSLGKLCAKLEAYLALKNIFCKRMNRNIIKAHQCLQFKYSRNDVITQCFDDLQQLMCHDAAVG